MKYLAILAAILGCALAFPAEEKVVGGAAASRNQFPYQCSMQWGILGIWQHICGCSILTTRTALTAAHCITETPSLGGFRIRAGILNLNDNVAGMQTINVQRNVVHELYQGGVNPHDVAVLILVGTLNFGVSIQPIGLPTPNAIPSGTAVLSGWGATGTGAMPNTLQFVNVPVLTLTQCRNALVALMGNAGPLHDNNVCTGPLTGGVSACSGDSGGPLAQGNSVIGIVSWGIMPCGTVGAPSVYGRVSAYNGWLQSNWV